jgi:hypothetical protein
MKICGSCFRYCESNKDAIVKGYKKIHSNDLGDYYRKPRPGVKAVAIGYGCPRRGTLWRDRPACKHHVYRWKQNIQIWWEWRFKDTVVCLYRRYVRVPIGGLRKPVELEWQDSFDGIADRIITNGEPVCPHCREMPYSDSQCVFCGQRFLPCETPEDKTAPQREMRDGELIMLADGICPECGFSCGNGGYGSLRCRCGWVGEELSSEARRDIEEMFAEEEGGRTTTEK